MRAKCAMPNATSRLLTGALLAGMLIFSAPASLAQGSRYPGTSSSQITISDRNTETNRIICRGGRISGRSCICPRQHVRLRVGTRRYWCVRRPQVSSPSVTGPQITTPPPSRTNPGSIGKGPTVRPGTGGFSRPGTRIAPPPTVTIRTPDRVIIRNPGGPVHQKTAKIPKMCSGGRIQNRKCVCRAGKLALEFAPGRFRCVVAASPPPASAAKSAAAANPKLVPDEILVSFPEGADDALINAVAADFGLTVLASQSLPLLGQRLVKYRIPQGSSLEDIAQRLGNDPRAQGISFNFLYGLSQHAASMSSSSTPPQYALRLLKLPQAQAIATGKIIRIGVIDSAIDDRHPAIRNAIKKHFDATGQPAPPRGPARVLQMKHGTAIASLIAASRTMRGAAPDAQLFAIRAFWRAPTGGAARSTSFVLAKAVGWAVSADVQLLNMSFAGPPDPLLEHVLAKAAAKGVIAVAAAGNGGPKASVAYPAAYGHVLAVTAVDARKAIYAQANRGRYVQLAAPGVEVFVAAPNASYDLLSGTSMAAALVTGTAALLLERQPDLDRRQLISALTQTARDLGTPGRDDVFGAGLIDAEALITSTARLSSGP